MRKCTRGKLSDLIYRILQRIPLLTSEIERIFMKMGYARSQVLGAIGTLRRNNKIKKLRRFRVNGRLEYLFAAKHFPPGTDVTIPASVIATVTVFFSAAWSVEAG